MFAPFGHAGGDGGIAGGTEEGFGLVEGCGVCMGQRGCGGSGGSVVGGIREGDWDKGIEQYEVTVGTVGVLGTVGVVW